MTYLSQFNNSPTVQAWKAAKRVLKYLSHTDDVGIKYYCTESALFGFSDANWGENIDRRSFGGYVFILSGGAVSWKTQKQATVAASSTESEYMAMAEAAKEAIFLGQIYLFLTNESVNPITIFADNRSALALSKNAVITTKSKHIDIKYHLIRDFVEKGLIELQYVSSEDNAADIFTKAISPTAFKICCEALGL